MRHTELSIRGFGGLRLAADAWGDPKHRGVLFAHGGGQTRHSWGETACTLARRGWYAVSIDMRGHGESEWAPDSDYRSQTFAHDLLAAARCFEHPPVVVGASLGGIAALIAYGEIDAEAFSGLVLVDIAPRLEVNGAVRIIRFMLDHVKEGFASLEEAADAIARYQPHRRRPDDLGGLRKNLREGPDGRYRWHWDPHFLTGDRRPSVISDPSRLDAAARKLTIPTLLVRGRLSDLISEASARHFLEQVPHAHYVDVSGAGHMVAGDRNDVFSQAVIDFLERLDGGAASCKRTEIPGTPPE